MIRAVVLGLRLNRCEAEGEAQTSAKRRYAGLTLSEWSDRIKSSDLKSSSSAELVPGLLEIVRDRQAPWVSRRLAGETLGRLGPRAEAGVPVLLALLEEPSEDETPPRVWGMKALALYGPVAEDAAPKLSGILHDAGRPLLERQLALEALIQIGSAHPAVLPDVIGLLARPGRGAAAATEREQNQALDAAQLRELAVESFTLLGPRGAPAIPALVRLLDDRADILRMKVAQALGAMGPRGEIAIPMLAERMLLDDSPLVRDAAGDALAKIGPESLPALTQLLADKDQQTRWRAAAALGQMGLAARPAAGPLKNCLSDESPVVRIRAAEALWRVAADAPAVIPVAVATLAEPDRQLRMRGARLLGSMGDHGRPAVPLLRELARDERPAVSRAAADVLRKMGEKSD